MKHYLLFTFILLVTVVFAQTPPQGFNYSSVIRADDNQAIPNTYVSVRLSIIFDSPNGATVYQEIHSDTTNQFGVINLTIGSGTTTVGNFSDIGWGAGNHYLQTELDDNGGTNFEIMGIAQFLSVPYALHSGNSFDNDTSSINELQQLSYSNDTLYLSDGGSVVMPNPTQLSDLNNDVGYITNSNDADSDPTNELQVLSVSNDTIFLSNGGFAKLPPAYSGTNTDNQTLTYQNDTLSISNGNSIPVPALSNDVTLDKKVTSGPISIYNVPNGWSPVPFNNTTDTLELQINVGGPNETFLVYVGYSLAYGGSSASSNSAVYVINSSGQTIKDILIDREDHSNGQMVTSCAATAVVTDLPLGLYTFRIMNYIDGALPPGNLYYRNSRHLLIRRL